MADVVNLQIATFAGLGLPRTLNRPVPSSTTTQDVLQQVYAVLPSPELGPRLIVSTIDGRALSRYSTEPISTYLTEGSNILPLRLSTRLCGGKGGFGSQLRAAGGRMSSRKNRDRPNVNGSNRNLDGRRLRTVDEAKQLAKYLEMKPEMEKKEREERRERWEAVIKAADETEQRIKTGKLGSRQGRLDSEYLENKELAEEKTREAVTRAMRENMLSEKTGSESSAEEAGSSEGDEQLDNSSDDADMPEAEAGPSFYGWDDYDDDDDMSEDDSRSAADQLKDELVEAAEDAGNESKRKGKQRAT